LTTPTENYLEKYPIELGVIGTKAVILRTVLRTCPNTARGWENPYGCSKICNGSNFQIINCWAAHLTDIDDRDGNLPYEGE
jgi:hypothetical protein